MRERDHPLAGPSLLRRSPSAQDFMGFLHPLLDSELISPLLGFNILRLL